MTLHPTLLSHLVPGIYRVFAVAEVARIQTWKPYGPNSCESGYKNAYPTPQKNGTRSRVSSELLYRNGTR